MGEQGVYTHNLVGVTKRSTARESEVVLKEKHVGTKVKVWREGGGGSCGLYR